jgi:hypothetical protein
MPEFFFYMNDPEVMFDPAEVFIRDGVAQLMAYNFNNEDEVALGGFDGYFVPVGVVTTRALKASAITNIFSLESDAYVPDRCAVMYRMSPNDGADWFVWNGVAWVAALPEDFNNFNTLEQINAGLGAMIIGVPTALKFQIALYSSPDRLSAPCVGELKLGVTYRFDFTDDIVRTVYDAIKNKNEILVTVPLTSNGTNKVGLVLEMQSIALSEVYDLTADPFQTVNLFLSYSGTEITMTRSVVTGHSLLVKGTAKVNVAVNPDPDYVLSHLPIYCIEMTREEDYAPARGQGDERTTNCSLKRGRVRTCFRRKDVSISLHCASKYESMSQNMVDALDRLFHPEEVKGANPLVSLATGMDLGVVDFSPLVNNNVIENKLHEKTCNLIVSGRVWREDGIEVPVAEEINVTLENKVEIRRNTNPGLFGD